MRYYGRSGKALHASSVSEVHEGISKTAWPFCSVNGATGNDAVYWREGASFVPDLSWRVLETETGPGWNRTLLADYPDFDSAVIFRFFYEEPSRPSGFTMRVNLVEEKIPEGSVSMECEKRYSPLLTLDDHPLVEVRCGDLAL